MTHPTLTTNATTQMLQMAKENGMKPNHFRPILQVLQCKAIQAGGGTGPSGNAIHSTNAIDKRYRMILSDGIHFAQCMMGTTGNYPSSFFEQDLVPNSFVQVNDYISNQVGPRTIFIVLNLSIVHGDVGYRIGQPTDVETGANESGQQPQQQQQTTMTGMYSAPPSSKPLYNSTNSALVTPPAAMTSTSMGGAYNKPDRPRSSSGVNPYGGSSSSSSTSHPTAPIVRSGASTIPSNITPISALNMYNNRWTIQARVTSKSDIRTWSNTKGEGSLFSIELLDTTADIKATFFKEAVDKFYPILDVNKIYTFTGGRLKVANMQYNTCKSNYEITFDQNAEIHLCMDSGTIIKQQYELIKIMDISNVDAEKNIDLLAVVKTCGTPTTIISKKKGQELTKCDLTLIDDSYTEINFTVWGKQAERAEQEFSNHPILAIRRARVSDYGGKSLTSGSGGGMVINPSSAEIPEVQSLSTWWQQNQHSILNNTNVGVSKSLSNSMGIGGRVESIQERKDVASIKNDGLGYNDKPDWLTFKGYCSFIKKDREGGAWYPACPNAGDPCKNLYKVIQTPDGQWRCEKCNGYYPKPVRRWIFTGVVEDHTGSTWVSFFNEQAEKLLGGMTADEAYNVTTNHELDGFDEDKYKSIFETALFTEYIFKCKVKNEIVLEENRIKTSVYAIHPIDYVKESIDMLAELEKM